jgi:DNA-binding protein H-NS
MKRTDLESLPTDELWALREKIVATLSAKLIAEKGLLETRLSQLHGRVWTKQLRKRAARRPYPIVFPKFRNPDQPSETWAGRGKQPRWLTAHLSSGKRIDDFRIEAA